jgi:TonB family protein
MASLSSPPRITLSHARVTRFGVAIGISVGVHVIVGLHVTVARSNFAAPRAVSPIFAQLEHATALPAAKPASDPGTLYSEAPALEAFRPRVSPQARRAAAAERPIRHAQEQGAAEPEATGVQVPAQRESSANEHYYSAHELDVYPKLRQPLRDDLEIIAGRTSPSLSLLIMVTLDEIGNVEDVSVVERKADAATEKQVREALHRAGFFPAEKDGQAVKSRLMMRIDWNAEAVARLP